MGNFDDTLSCGELNLTLYFSDSNDEIYNPIIFDCKEYDFNPIYFDSHQSKSIIYTLDSELQDEIVKFLSYEEENGRTDRRLRLYSYIDKPKPENIG